ncbi:hypothetical protein I0P11_09775 [Acinetobacter baumannii]|uniref:hypothetical protein n=1 Tax=Acinetobacter baumannii TaxID=470 RepID=UPI0018AFCD07|nr:hypothetical protein [Acinetobacter baumannii]MBF9261422.1 hypothetical protein [Acinetobacter baumannii]MDC4659167.1 hypothetical protein [Acinetobacter baumannii]MDC5572258.1 hypothetical protein [Acinetobacter baumannii]MDV7497325.1 hypothetical protein [Acinetobacter baumannii]WNX59878.1 hypothetical protein RWU60_18000 [Acinetobacter baumannii]
MIQLKREPSIFFLCALFFCFTLDVQAPLAFYGTQFIGLSILTLCRFYIYPYIRLDIIKILILSIVLLELLCFFQYLYIQQTILILVYQKVIFLIAVALLMYDYIIKANIDILRKSIAFYICFLSFIVITQFSAFYFLGVDRSLLDFGILLGGEESRTWYVGDWMYRPTGITSEPAVFVGVQFGLLTLQYFVDKNAKFSRVLGILSLTLSMSFLGLILSALYLLIIYSKNIKNYIFGGIAIFVFYLFSFEMINERIQRFNDGDDGSNNVKLQAIQYFFSDFNMIVGGYGFLFPSKNSPQFYDALLDLTFYLNTITVFGVLIGSFILILFVYLLFRSNTTIKEKLLICLSLIKLSNPSVLFFACFALLCFSILNKRNFLK